jgi:hypothetical protein
MDGRYRSVATLVRRRQAYDERSIVVDLNAAFVCASSFENCLRRIRAVDPGARNRKRRPGCTEEVI